MHIVLVRILYNPFRVSLESEAYRLPRVALRLPWAELNSPFGAELPINPPLADALLCWIRRLPSYDSLRRGERGNDRMYAALG